MADNSVLTEENAGASPAAETVDPVEQLKAELEQSSQAFEKSFVSGENAPAKTSVKRRKRPRYLVGGLSAALSMIIMGIAMVVSLFSPTGILSAFKIAPIMLVLVGLEILLNIVIRKSARIMFDLRSLMLCLAMILITFLLSLISLITTTMGADRYYAEARLENMLSHQLSSSLADYDNLRKIDIKVNLYGENPDAYDNLSDLRDSDIINLIVNYQKAPASVFEFAGECREIMNELSEFDYAFGSVTFIADDEITFLSLVLEWNYQKDMSAAELVGLVGYYGEDLETDIPDLE